MAAPPASSKAIPAKSSTRSSGVAIVFVYDAVVSLIILKLIDWTIGLRVPKEIEIEGLDLTLHGETVQ